MSSHPSAIILLCLLEAFWRGIDAFDAFDTFDSSDASDASDASNIEVWSSEELRRTEENYGL